MSDERYMRQTKKFRNTTVVVVKRYMRQTKKSRNYYGVDREWCLSGLINC
jgi:hypothetical protein